MGKVFITDEGDNAYVADVTRGGNLSTTKSKNLFYHLPTSAHSLISAITAYGSACYFDKVIVGQRPGTAACLGLYDCAFCAGAFSAFDQQSGSQVIGLLHLDVSGAATGATLAAQYPAVFPINVYCSSGIAVAISHSGSSGKTGDVDDVTIVYHT